MTTALVRNCVCILFAITLLASPVFAQDSKTKGRSDNPFPNAVSAPELEGGVEWLNTNGPISLRDLRGKVVLLDFWTFCCINCMHILPDLKYLEHKYPKELVVIGVHSAKFDNEKESGNIRKAILRYEIEHPVINDANMILWRKFRINSWPSLVLIDPEGNYCGSVSGEGNRKLLDEVIEKVVAYHKAKKTLDESPVKFDLERNHAPPTPLRFPGKLVVDQPGNRLFISDSNNNRIVISSLDGKLIDVVGSGAIGSKNGSYADAQFDRPQGMLLIGDNLYVADTENHQIRIVHLDTKNVTTLAGTGDQAAFRSTGGPLRQADLNSPWDLCVVDKVMYVAMAGPHQIWSHKLGSDSIHVYAGSGREDILNGSLEEGAMAQPSGITTDGESLYVVDSEGSSVRQITTKPNQNLSRPKGEITTIAGTHDLPRGASLFAFGDVDGEGSSARFQHPLGLVLHDNGLFVADSYNHKIKHVDLKTHGVTTWLGDGTPGNDLTHLAEPAGLAIADGKMYIADTNNHRILVADLQSKQTKEFVIEGLEPPKPPTIESNDNSKLREVAVDAQKVTGNGAIDFHVSFALPSGFKLNSLMPVTYKIASEDDNGLVAADHQNARMEATSDGTTATFKIPVTNKAGKATLTIALTYGYCRDGKGGLCKVDSLKFKVPVELTEGADAKVIELKASPKQQEK